MARSRRWIWIALLIVVVLLILPMPIAERYTSPTQEGQYLLHPIRAYRFILAAAEVSRPSKLNSSGKALTLAKQIFQGTEIRPTKVELLFFPDPKPYSYRTKNGRTLSIVPNGRFVWEVWGIPSDGRGNKDVVALLDYTSGELLGSVK